MLELLIPLYLKVTDGINKQGFELNQLKSQWEVFRTQLGDKMQPAMGTVIGGMSNIVSSINGMRNRSEDMTSALTDLITSTANYRSVLNSLNVNIDDLSSSEKALYDIRVAQAGLNLQKTTNELAKSYTATERQLESLEKRYNKLQSTRERDLSIVNSATQEEKAAVAYYQTTQTLLGTTRKHESLYDAMMNLNDAVSLETELQQKQNEKIACSY